MGSLRLTRLAADYEDVRRLAHLHPRIEVEGVEGTPPERYFVQIEARSLREKGDELVIAKKHRVEITLPLAYPRDPPLLRMLTPVFHPNIAPHAICVGDDWSAAESLDSLIQRIGEMLCFQSYNVKSPLNGRAARWVEENGQRLPLDREEFFRDLQGAAGAPRSRGAGCTNCGSRKADLTTCRAEHRLCPDCSGVCQECGGVLCIVCGPLVCTVCSGLPCSNCGVRGPIAHTCPNGHEQCDDCSIDCDHCGRSLCLTCEEVRTHDCVSPGAAIPRPPPLPPPLPGEESATAVVVCGFCRRRVILKNDGTCPSCGLAAQ